MQKICDLKEYLNSNIWKDILSILIIFLFPPLLLFFGIYNLKKRNDRIAYFQIALFLGWIAYCTIPYEGSDLYSHYQVIDRLSNKTLDRIFDFGYEFVYLNNFIMWLIGHIGNYALYQGVLTFIGYYFLFKYIKEISSKKSIKRKYLIFILIFIFFLSYYRTYIFAIRNYFCFILGTYFYYKYQKGNMNKWIFLLLILFLSFIHPSSLIFYILFLFDYIKNKKIKYCIYFFVLFNQVILEILSLFFEHKNPFLDKIFGYVDLFYVVNINSLILYILTLIFAIFIIYRLKKHNIKIKQNIILLIILNLSLITNQELLRRFIYLIPLFIIEPLFDFYNIEQKKYIYIGNLIMIGLCFVAFMYMVAATRAYGWNINMKFLVFPLFNIFGIGIY